MKKKVFLSTFIIVFTVFLQTKTAFASVTDVFAKQITSEWDVIVEVLGNFIDLIFPPDEKSLNNETFYRVTRVVDGDTFEILLNGEETVVRMLGIDTPETKDPRTGVQCFGNEAYLKAAELMEGRYVRLEPDSTQADRDYFGRLLRYVYTEDGTFVNSEMIKQGFAFSYREYPTQLLDEFNSLEEQARKENRGLWGSCPINSLQ